MRKTFFPTVIILLCTSAILFTACAAMIEASNPKKNPSASTEEITSHEWWLQSVRAADGGSMLYPDRFAGQYVSITVSPKNPMGEYNDVHKYNRPSRCGNEMSLSRVQIHPKGFDLERWRKDNSERMAIEAALTKTLNIADSYEISGGILRLKYKGSVLATFTSYK